VADNACGHTREGDVIRVGAAVTGDRARLWVHDNGTGVPDHDAERIFERFTRGTDRTSRNGAGLGLSIVRATAEAHGVTVHLVPIAEAGARFEIDLPVSRSTL
jgi:signal transduction histidine kinase